MIAIRAIPIQIVPVITAAAGITAAIFKNPKLLPISSFIHAVRLLAYRL
jgi:hypothetical protein